MIRGQPDPMAQVDGFLVRSEPAAVAGANPSPAAMARVGYTAFGEAFLDAGGEQCLVWKKKS